MSEIKPENAPERKKMSFLLIVLEFYTNFYYALDCPGTQSETAGKASACEGCPNQNICSSAPKGPDPGKWLILHLLY